MGARSERSPRPAASCFDVRPGQQQGLPRPQSLQKTARALFGAPALDPRTLSARPQRRTRRHRRRVRRSVTRAPRDDSAVGPQTDSTVSDDIRCSLIAAVHHSGCVTVAAGLACLGLHRSDVDRRRRGSPSDASRFPTWLRLSNRCSGPRATSRTWVAALRSRVPTSHMLGERAATTVLQVRQFANSCWRRTKVTASSLE
jgi:hypothetical protein